MVTLLIDWAVGGALFRFRLVKIQDRHSLAVSR